MDDGVKLGAEDLKNRLEEVRRRNKGRMSFRRKSLDLLSEIVEFQKSHKISSDDLCLLLGISKFQIYYIRKKVRDYSKEPVRMKRVKIISSVLRDKIIRVNSKGFEIYFSDVEDVVQFIKGVSG